MPTLLDQRPAPRYDPVGDEVARRRAEQELLMRQRQQAMSIDAEQAARARASAPLDLQAKQQALDANRQQTTEAARKTANERGAATMQSDALQWADKSNPQYHVPWDALPQEAKQHFGADVYGENAAKAPEAYNRAFVQGDGVIPGLEHLVPSGSSTDENGNVRVQRSAPEQFDPSKPRATFNPATGEVKTINAAPTEPQFDQFTTPQEVEARMPSAEFGIAQQLSRHDISIANLSRFPANTKMAIINAAQTLNPDWRAADFPTRQASRRAFTSGTLGANKTSINTAIHHLDTVLSLADAMKNTGSPGVNAPLNTVGRFVGTKAGNATRQFDLAAGLMATELAKLVKGGVPTGKEVEEQKLNFSYNLPADVLKSNIATAVELLAGKLDGLRTQYQDAYGQPNKFGFIDPESRKILDKHGFDTNRIDPVSPGEKDAAPSSPQPDAQANVTKEAYDALPSGAAYFWNGKQLQKK